MQAEAIANKPQLIVRRDKKKVENRGDEKGGGLQKETAFMQGPARKNKTKQGESLLGHSDEPSLPCKRP